MRFYYSISFRIWMTFMLLLMSVLSFFMIYYPLKQKKLLIEFKKNELRETVNSVASAVELALTNDDYDGVKLAITRASEKRDFEFIAVILEENGAKSILASYPEVEEKEIINRADEDIIYESSNFQYDDIKGEIVVAFSKIKINNTIKTLTQPIYVTTFILLIISVLLFYLLANRLSKPISNLIKITNELKEQNFETAIQASDSRSEIGSLHNSIASLQENLILSRKKNKELTDGLEMEVQVRTAELKSTAEKLLIAQNSARIGNFEYNIENNLWEASPIVYDILNLPQRSTYPIEVFLDLLQDQDKQDALAFFSTIEQENTFYEKDFKIVFKNQQPDSIWVHFIYSVVFGEDGQAHIIQGTIQDITYRKKIEEELQELSLVAKNTSNYVIITDKEKRIKWVNESLLKVSGYSFEELIGKSPKIFQFEKTNKDTITLIQQKLNNNEEVKTEILNRGKHGNEYWLELNIVPLKNDKGDSYGYIAVETDITEIKKSEDDVKKLNESLEVRVLENTKKNLELSSMIVEQEKLATIGELAAGVAHDLNTPLSSTKVGAESLQFALREIMRTLPTLSHEDQKDAIEIAENIKTNLAISGLQKKREEIGMLKYLNEKYNRPEDELTMIAYKLTECRIQVQDEAIIEKILKTKIPIIFLELIYNLQLKNALLESIVVSTENASSVVRNIRSFINKGTTPDRTIITVEENIRIVLNIFQHELKKDVQLEMNIEPNLKILGFDIKLFQLWSNLVKNALDAMDSQENKKISIHGFSNEDQVVITFSNNGPKIPKEDLQRIFKKFYTTKRSKSGTGLGLSIVKNVLETHHAKVNVESTEETTTFTILFPKPAILN